MKNRHKKGNDVRKPSIYCLNTNKKNLKNQHQIEAENIEGGFCKILEREKQFVEVQDDSIRRQGREGVGSEIAIGGWGCYIHIINEY